MKQIYHLHMIQEHCDTKTVWVEFQYTNPFTHSVWMWTGEWLRVYLLLHYYLAWDALNSSARAVCSQLRRQLHLFQLHHTSLYKLACVPWFMKFWRVAKAAKTRAKRKRNELGHSVGWFMKINAAEHHFLRQFIMTCYLRAVGVENFSLSNAIRWQK